jgi:hypothetical protein
MSLVICRDLDNRWTRQEPLIVDVDNSQLGWIGEIGDRSHEKLMKKKSSYTDKVS